MLTHSFKFLTW